MPEFNWAIIGPGHIANRFAEAAGTGIHAVYGRNQGNARAFADRHQQAGAPAIIVAPDVASMLRDEAIDAVYIATPHSGHAQAARACLAAGKPVLCEKPLTPTLQASRELVAMARQHNTFLMEALWSRFLPLYASVGTWLAEGAIGTVHSIQSSFCFPAPCTPDTAGTRLYNPALAGGALLDIGIYNVALSRWVLERALGACPAPTAINAHGVLAPTGVDQSVHATLAFPGGQVAQVACSFDAVSDNSLRILGSQGCIVVPKDFWQATTATLQRHGAEPEHIERPFATNGFEYEIAEVMRCVRGGLKESPGMPHAETLAIADCLEQLQHKVGAARMPLNELLEDIA